MRTILKLIPVVLLVITSCASPKQKEQVAQKPVITIDSTYKKTEPVTRSKTNYTVYKQAPQQVITVSSIYKKLSKQPQVFHIITSKDTVITCKEGTKLTIPQNAFVSKTGKQITGEVQLKTEEFYSKSDIVLAGLTTLSDGKLLESGGMLNLKAIAGGEEVQLKVGTRIRIEMPTKEKKEGMQLFNGVKGKDGKVNWVLAERNLPIKVIKEDMTFVGESLREVVSETIRIEGANKEELAKTIVEHPLAEVARKTNKCTLYNFSFNIYSNGHLQALKFYKQGKLVKNPDITFMQRRPGKCNFDFNEITTLNFDETLHIGIDGNYSDVKGVNTISINISQLAELKKLYNSFPYKVDISLELGPDGYTLKRAEIEKQITENKQINTGDLSFYVFSSSKMGLINCDRFYSDPNQRIAFKVSGGRDSEVKLLFNDINSYMSSFDSASVNYFNNVPMNKKVTLVAVKVVDNNPYIAIKESNTSETQVELDYKKVTIAELKERMKKLNVM